MGESGDLGSINSLDEGCFKLGLLEPIILLSSSTNFLSLFRENEFPLVDLKDCNCPSPIDS